jgi:hypothetical protein
VAGEASCAPRKQIAPRDRGRDECQRRHDCAGARRHQTDALAFASGDGERRQERQERDVISEDW